MKKPEKEPKDISTGARMADLGTAKVSAIKHKLMGKDKDQNGENYVVDPTNVEDLIKDWPMAPQRAAKQMIEQYGQPNEATPVRLIWYGNGPWKRTEVMRDEIIHNFPTPHTDFITQWIDYQVPVEKFADIARFDGSCLVDRTTGEVGARCDTESANTLTMNMMHEIVTGKRTVDQARKEFAESSASFVLGRPTPYAERLTFKASHSKTSDPDESIIAGPMARQMKEKAKDMFKGE